MPIRTEANTSDRGAGLVLPGLGDTTDPLPVGLTLAFHRATTVGQLHRFFGIPGPTWSTQRLGDCLEETGDAPTRLGPFLLAAGADDPDFIQLTYEPIAEVEA